MEMTLQDRLEQLLQAYSHYYDISRDVTVDGGSFPATAFFHAREESYLTTKSLTFAASEQHEYAYFYVADHLDVKTLQEQIELSKNAGLERIVPGGSHMCSYVTLVILANTIDPEAKEMIKKYRFRKNYRLALHGWMEYHIAAIECSTMGVLSNPAGKDARKTLEQNFCSRAK